MGLDLYLSLEKPIKCKCCNNIAGYKEANCEDFGSSSDLYYYVINDLCAPKHEEDVDTYVLDCNLMKKLLTYLKEHDLSTYLQELVVTYLNRIEDSPDYRVTFYASY